MIDVSPVVPEARQTVTDAAQVYLEHTRPWFMGLLIHGSALKGGFIPGCSDIDLQLYLNDSAFDGDGNLPLSLGLAIHRDLSKIDPAPFQYIQCYPLPERPEAQRQKDWTGPIPGTYHVLVGELPVPEATPQQLLTQARRSLETLNPVPFNVANSLLEHGGGRLARHVRLLCTDVWPALYKVLTCLTKNPLEVWKLPKDAAIELLPEDEPPGIEIRRFYQGVKAYYSGQQSVEEALVVIEQGVGFMRAAKEWYASFSEADVP